MTSKMTFGFRDVNGSAFNIRLVETPTGRWPSAKTFIDLRSYVIKTMNKHGKQAERLTKTPGWSPFKTGALIKSIKWIKAQESDKDSRRVIRGALTVGVPYGRRQEFEHSTRGLYLQRALEAVYPAFLADLQDRNILGDVLFARRRQAGESGVVRGGNF